MSDQCAQKTFPKEESKSTVQISDEQTAPKEETPSGSVGAEGFDTIKGVACHHATKPASQIEEMSEIKRRLSSGPQIPVPDVSELGIHICCDTQKSTATSEAKEST